MDDDPRFILTHGRNSGVFARPSSFITVSSDGVNLSHDADNSFGSHVGFKLVHSPADQATIAKWKVAILDYPSFIKETARRGGGLLRDMVKRLMTALFQFHTSRHFFSWSRDLVEVANELSPELYGVACTRLSWTDRTIPQFLEKLINGSAAFLSASDARAADFEPSIKGMLSQYIPQPTTEVHSMVLHALVILDFYTGPTPALHPP